MDNANPLDLQRQNLNQLVSLNALLSTASVTRAAEVTGVSQPTMSKSLLGLRRTFQDQLLVREGNAMHLTPFARDLSVKVQAALRHLTDLYYPPERFSPQTAEGWLRIGANDFVLSVLGIPFMKHLRSAAPNLRVEFRPVGTLYPEQLLANGVVDLAVGLKWPAISVRQQFAFADPFVCVASGSNTHLPDRLDLDNFLRLRHVDVSPSGTGMLRQIFERTQKSFKSGRQFAAVISSFLSVPSFLEGSDIVALVPSRIVGVLPKHALRRIDLDFELPTYDVSVWWHNRTHADPLIQWARQALVQLARDGAKRKA